MKKIAYKEMYDNEQTHAWYIASKKLMLNYLKKNLKKNAKILDAGCGTGGTLVKLKKVGFSHIIGIDISDDALKYSRQRNLKVSKGDVNKIKLKSNIFDAVISLDVLYHKRVNIKSAIVEYYRVLKPNGILYIQEPAYNWLRSTHDKVIETNHRFTIYELNNILNSQHFQVNRSFYFNSILLPLLILKRGKDNIISRQINNSDVYRLPKYINTLVLMIFNFEIFLANYVNIPFGLSVICTARK